MPIGSPCQCPHCAASGGCPNKTAYHKYLGGVSVGLCRRCGPAWCGRPLSDAELLDPPAGAVHRIEEERRRAAQDEKERERSEDVRSQHNIVLPARLWYALVIEAGGPRKVSALIEIILQDYFSRKSEEYARIARKDR
jgi:hypothetical protein